MKLEEITPQYEKVKQDQKEHYRRVNILPNLSKILERFLFKQISRFLDRILTFQVETGLYVTITSTITRKIEKGN